MHGSLIAKINAAHAGKQIKFLKTGSPFQIFSDKNFSNCNPPDFNPSKLTIKTTSYAGGVGGGAQEGRAGGDFY